MTELSPLEQGAIQAHRDYMDIGATMPIGGIPLPEMQSWVTATEGMTRWPAHQAIDVGWLCLETALFAGFENADGGHSAARSSQYSHEALLDRSRDHWDRVASDPSSYVPYRARAIWALGAVEAYSHLAQNAPEVDLFNYQEKQLEAASLLYKAYSRHGDSALLRDLHTQTVTLLLNGTQPKDESFKDLSLPLPTRFQSQDNAARADALYWRWDSIDVAQAYLLGTSPSDGVRSKNIINIPPSMLENDKLSSKSGQGTVEAIISLLSGKARVSRTQFDTLRLHITRVSNNMREIVRLHLTDGVRPAIDPENGLEQAYDWYAMLGPNYQMSTSDANELEQAINPFEIALANGTADHEDMLTLAWLWFETDLATDGKGGFARAEDCFDLAADEAQEREDWPAYCGAKLDKTVASFYRRLQDPAEKETARELYSQELQAVAQGMVNGLQELQLSKDSAHYPKLQSIGRRLAVSMLFADGRDGYVAFVPPTRQRGIYKDHAVGSDLLLRAADDYTAGSVAKVRLDAVASKAYLDEGIASVGVLDAFGQEYSEDITPLLQTLLEGDTNFLCDRIKRRVYEAAIESVNTIE